MVGKFLVLINIYGLYFVFQTRTDYLIVDSPPNIVFPCLASIKTDCAIDIMDEEWYDELTLYCEENSTDHIECSVCHAR